MDLYGNIHNMKIDKPKYRFKIQDSKKTAYQIIKLLNSTSRPKEDVSNILKFYNIKVEDIISGNGYDFYKLNDMIDRENNSDNKLQNIRDELQQMWDEYHDEYFTCLQNALCVEFDSDGCYDVNCYLQLTRSDSVNFEDNTIFLNYQESVKEVFKKFIILLTKINILDRWKKDNDWGWNYTYSGENKVWMFAEIAVDAVFNNTLLNKICKYPSCKYFYSLTIGGVYFMDKFRELYNKVKLEDFLNSVFIFVRDNYQSLVKFKNYLY